MTLANLMAAIANVDAGLVAFNSGNTRSIRFGQRWYPLRATVNEAMRIAGMPNNLTTHNCLVALADLHGFVRTEKINYLTNLSIALNAMEIIEEAKLLNKNLQDLL